MKKIGIIGGTGYTGSELARLLCSHPDIEIASMTSRQNAGKNVSDIQTNLKGYVDIKFTEDVGTDVDLVFIATPHGVAMNEAPKFIDNDIKVIDMSGDYRIHDHSVYEKWYGHQHTDLKNLPDSVYGIPELFRNDIKKADLVANPGCYATSAVLAMAPLFKSGIVDKDVIVDGKSGTSGAGMVPSPRLHHPFCGESLIPYSIGNHRHTPEMEMALNLFSKKDAKILFVPHLLPIVRGMMTTCYLSLNVADINLSEIFSEYYGKEHFIHFVDDPSIRAVVGSNHCQIAAKVFGNKVIVLSAIDNLVKGASGQAVQCANLMLGLDERKGLDFPGLGV